MTDKEDTIGQQNGQRLILVFKIFICSMTDISLGDELGRQRRCLKQRHPCVDVPARNSEEVKEVDINWGVRWWICRSQQEHRWPDLNYCVCVCVCVCVCLDLFNQKGVRKSSKVYICVWSYSSLLTVLRRRQWQATPVFLPGKSHGRRSLVGYSPWGREDSDSTERLHFHFSLSFTGEENGNPLQYCWLENPRDGSLVGCRLWGRPESGTTDMT